MQKPPHLRKSTGKRACSNCAAFLNGKCLMFGRYPVTAKQVCDDWSMAPEKGEEVKFTPRSYSQSFTSKGEDLLEVKPSWWRGVFFREKVKRISVNDVCKALANAAKEHEEELLKELWSK